MFRITLLNAIPDTGNLGVSALGLSVMGGFSERIDDLDLTVVDSGVGLRRETIRLGGRPFQYTRCGVRLSRRVYRPESIWNIRMAGAFGGGWNPIAKHLMSQDCAVDITGGDSFTDLYGAFRFNSVTQLKELFLGWGIPLGLLPQTYGPFKSSLIRQRSMGIIRQSSFAWARDERSFGELTKLLGGEFLPNRHRCGVDVAFLLETLEPVGDSRVTMQRFLDTGKPVVGINISGLIYNDCKAASEQYGFVADYRRAMVELITRLLEDSDANVLLIPHVIVPPGNIESDVDACQHVYTLLEKKAQGRLAVLPSLNDPRQVKWVISRCDWFCATRMHAAIAGLSSGVPTAAVAYSLKTAGVFESCDQGDRVADPRATSTDAVVEQLWHSWMTRAESRRSLAVAMPTVFQKAKEQMDEIAFACVESRTGTPMAVSHE